MEVRCVPSMLNVRTHQEVLTVVVMKVSQEVEKEAEHAKTQTSVWTPICVNTAVATHGVHTSVCVERDINSQGMDTPVKIWMSVHCGQTGVVRFVWGFVTTLQEVTAVLVPMDIG